MKKILIHTSTRGFRIEEPLLHAGYCVVGIPEMAGKNKVSKFFKLVKIAAREDPRLILVDSAGLMLMTAYLLSTLFRIPFASRARADIWALYEDQKNYLTFERRIYQYILLKVCERIYRKSVRLFPVSEYLKDILKGKGINEGKIRVLRLSIDHERFHPVRKETSRIKLLSVMNLSYMKKVEGLLEILPAIDDLLTTYENVEYKIAGRGRFSAVLKEKLQSVKNKEKMVYVGYRKDIETLFAEADIFIHYSHLDSYATVVAEAMACGIPVVANNFDGMIEIVESGTGFLVSDVSSLKEAVKMLIEDRKMREDMGERGRSSIVERCDISVIAKSYKKEIDEILIMS